jgi:hypothetical protein
MSSHSTRKRSSRGCPRFIRKGVLARKKGRVAPFSSIAAWQKDTMWPLTSHGPSDYSGPRSPEASERRHGFRLRQLDTVPLQRDGSGDPTADGELVRSATCCSAAVRLSARPSWARTPGMCCGHGFRQRVLPACLRSGRSSSTTVLTLSPSPHERCDKYRLVMRGVKAPGSAIEG